jgi:tRNA (mo5U34)-methyltransferase
MSQSNGKHTDTREQTITKLGPWFHNLHLPDGARRGASVTGIDVNPHYLDRARWAAAEFGFIGRVQFHEMQAYDLAHRTETYDLVLFMGVFHHLRYPLLGLDIVARKVGRLLLFQSLSMPGEEVCDDTYDHDIYDRAPMREPGWPKMAFIEHRFASDPTNWWVPNHAGVEAMLRSTGLRVLGRPAHECYLCEPDPANLSCVSTWNAGELQAAVAAVSKVKR